MSLGASLTAASGEVVAVGAIELYAREKEGSLIHAIANRYIARPADTVRNNRDII